MKKFIPIIALAVIAVPFATLAADPGSEQGEARREMRAGNIRSIREIEARILPSMQGAQYLGPEYDPTAMAYRLKFLRDGRVVFIDVDARSGALLGGAR